MKGPERVVLCGIALLVAAAGSARAYDEYSTNAETGNCATCHGNFRTTPYTSKVDNTSWGDDLHDVHRRTMLSSDCDACHLSSGRFPVKIGNALGGNGLAPYSCSGCHGRSQDGTGTGTEGFGAGLRQRHWRGGITSCVDCHSDANPASKMPVGENVLPPFYANPGTVHPNIPDNPCNPPPAYRENFKGTTIGLDNDGDGLFDMADSNCVATAATPGEAAGRALAPLLVTGHAPAARQVNLAWGIACGATDNVLYFGPLSGVSTYAYSGQQCALGNTGSYTWTYPTVPASLFFLITARDAAKEGSYGRSSAGAERPPSPGNAVCPLPQDLASRCD